MYDNYLLKNAKYNKNQARNFIKDGIGLYELEDKLKCVSE